MFKPVTIFLLIISIALFFGGTASAALTVNVTVVNNSVTTTVTHPGAHGGINILASTNNESIKDPMALITTTPYKGLMYDIKNAYDDC